MFGIGAQELILILVVALIVFGPKRLPDLARSLGRGMAEFRRASSDLRQSIQLDSEPEPDERAPDEREPAANDEPAAAPDPDRKPAEPGGE